jgi:hypothetical protein
VRTPSVGCEPTLVAAFMRLADTPWSPITTSSSSSAGSARTASSCPAADAAGLMLGDQRDSLQVVAPSNQAAQLVELCQLRADQGPCPGCYATGTQVEYGTRGSGSATHTAARRTSRGVLSGGCSAGAARRPSRRTGLDCSGSRRLVASPRVAGFAGIGTTRARMSLPTRSDPGVGTGQRHGARTHQPTTVPSCRPVSCADTLAEYWYPGPRCPE